MSERMTVDAARTNFEASVAYAYNPFKGETIKANWTGTQQSHMDAAFDRLKQAILDEGLKEERARVDGLVEAVAALDETAFTPDLRFRSSHGIPMEMRTVVVLRLRQLRAALAAVRESQEGKNVPA